MHEMCFTIFRLHFSILHSIVLIVTHIYVYVSLYVRFVFISYLNFYSIIVYKSLDRGFSYYVVVNHNK